MQSFSQKWTWEKAVSKEVFLFGRVHKYCAVISVMLETMKQVESKMLARNYKGVTGEASYKVNKKVREPEQQLNYTHQSRLVNKKFAKRFNMWYSK